MKVKKFQRKLSLGKATIANLSNAEMQMEHGGAITVTCPKPCSVETFCLTECAPSKCVC